MKKKQTLLKALVVSDEQENSWFLSGGFHEATDLMDVKALRVNMRDFHSTLREIVQQTPDVLLLDSTLSSPYVVRMAVHVRDKMPNLPILMLPNIQGALIQSAETDDTVNSASGKADTVARSILYTHGRLGLQRTLLQMALRDDLTGLHNRRGFIALATQQLTWARDSGQHMVMFFADLDGLKWINDRYGHGEGDRAISLAAACIKETFRKFDVTARLSGDEFVALIMEEPGRSAETICRRLQMNLADCAGTESPYRLSMSVGVAHFDPDKPVTLQELMRQADTGLYEHKRKNRLAASKGRWPSAAPLEMNPSGSLALMATGPLMDPTMPRG
jgi:two-component system, cell cycle response regulator